MKAKAYFWVLMALALAGSLSSCEKFGHGREIRFRAATAIPGGQSGTKTVYSGDVDNGRERIDWKAGDVIRIASDVARTEGDLYYANYVISGTIEDSDEISKANLDVSGESGLEWGSGTHHFWGIYPSHAIAVSGSTATVSGLSISATQNVIDDSDHKTTSSTLTAFAPDLSNAWMLADKSGVTESSSSDLEMDFYPAFTAFEFTLKSQQATPITVKSFTLSSSDTDIAGTFDVTAFADGGLSTYGNFSDGSRSIAVSFGSTGVEVTDEKSLTFTVLALPQALSNLTITFGIELNGLETTRALALKQNDSFITFGACQKHRITGLALDNNEFWLLKVNGDVRPWNGVSQTIQEEVSISGKVAITGAIETTDKWKTDFNAKSNHYADSNWEEGGSAGYDKNYQIRTLNKDLPAAQRYFTLTFTPSAPTGGYWQLIPLYKEDDVQSPNHFRFERDIPGGGTTDELKGQILNQQETIRIYPMNWDPSDVNTYNVWFTCRFSTSPTFSHAINADSEFQDVHGDGRFSYWVFRLKQYSEVYPTD